MKMHYDEQVDALYLSLDESDVVESEEVKPGIILDFNAAGEVVGIEVLDVKRRVPSADLKELKFEVASARPRLIRTGAREHRNEGKAEAYPRQRECLSRSWVRQGRGGESEDAVAAHDADRRLLPSKRHDAGRCCQGARHHPASA